MKWMKLAVAVAATLAFGNAYAFHEGGVAECDGCHVMHNASNGRAGSVVAGAPNPTQNLITPYSNPRTDQVNAYLLQGSDQSSTCLLCHAGTGSATAQYKVLSLSRPDFSASTPNYTPGGDFAWLGVSFGGFSTDTLVTSSPGRMHGHNVVAADFQLTETDRGQAPGGAFITGTGLQSFACSNCHDPHGRYRLTGSSSAPVVAGPGVAGQTNIGAIVQSGSYGDVPTGGNAVGVYRLLAGKGYLPASNITSSQNQFVNDPPIAVAPKTYNQAEGSNEVRVAYGAGMSEWCQNCHGAIHLDTYVSGTAGLKHPAGNGAKFRTLQADIYNSYKSSGNLTGANVYTSLVPYETGVTDLVSLKAGASNTQAVGSSATGALAIASTSSNVMCLSCHRAHASGWDSMVRWNMSSTFVTLGTHVPGTDNSNNSNNGGSGTANDYANGRKQAQTVAAYYGRDVGSGFSAFQRSLCNKCHGKD